MALSSIGANAGVSSGVSIKQESPIYARKGEPTYVAQMDSDEDGTITFDEFREYCKENELSSDEVLKLLEARNAWKLLQAKKEAQDEEEEEESCDSIDFDDYLEYYKQSEKEDSEPKGESYVNVEA